jgi:hypothetical protein
MVEETCSRSPKVGGGQGAGKAEAGEKSQVFAAASAGTGVAAGRE